MIQAYTGIPYKSKGRDWSGVDCWGLVCLLLKHELDINLPSYVKAYASAEDKLSVNALIEKTVPKWHEVAKPEFGDVVVFNIFGLPMHVGVCLGAGDFMHAFKGTAVCVERLGSITWSKRISGVYRCHRI